MTMTKRYLDTFNRVWETTEDEPDLVWRHPGGPSWTPLEIRSLYEVETDAGPWGSWTRRITDDLD